jgi:hypothetical protein
MNDQSQLGRIGERAAHQLAGLLGAPPERVTSLHKSEHGWSANIEVLETHRVPETTDVLADYEVDLTTQGEIVGYRRARRYLRCETVPH